MRLIATKEQLYNLATKYYPLPDIENMSFENAVLGLGFILRWEEDNRKCHVFLGNCDFKTDLEICIHNKIVKRHRFSWEKMTELGMFE